VATNFAGNGLVLRRAAEIVFTESDGENERSGCGFGILSEFTDELDEASQV
jgi:hypothetical protein